MFVIRRNTYCESSVLVTSKQGPTSTEEDPVCPSQGDVSLKTEGESVKSEKYNSRPFLCPGVGPSVSSGTVSSCVSTIMYTSDSSCTLVENMGTQVQTVIHFSASAV